MTGTENQASELSADDARSPNTGRGRAKLFGPRKSPIAILTASPAANRRKKEKLIDQVRALAHDARPGTSPWQLDRARHRWRRIGPAGPGHEQRLVAQFRAACEDFYRACSGQDAPATRQRPAESALGATDRSAPTSPARVISPPTTPTAEPGDHQ
jgi:hypothetical protein